MQFNDAVIDLVDQVGFTSWSGTAFRYTTRGRDPLSGAGAQAYGGRWNPRGEFPVIYLAVPETTCISELDRASEAASVTTQDRLDSGLDFHTVTLEDLPVLDLRSASSLMHVGLSIEAICDPDWTACQSVGFAAWFLHASAVFAPSATGNGNVLAVFEHRLQPGQIAVRSSVHLTEELYIKLRAHTRP